MEDAHVRIRSLGTSMWCGLDRATHQVVCAGNDPDEAAVFRMKQTGNEHATIMYEPGNGDPAWGCEVDKQQNGIICNPDVRWEQNPSSMFRFELHDERLDAFSMCWGPRLNPQTKNVDCVPRPGETFTHGLRDYSTQLACHLNILPRHLDICSVTAGRVECTHHTTRHRPVTGAGYSTIQRTNYASLFQIVPIE